MGETFVTIATLGAPELDLDQLVIVERAPGLGDDRWRDAMLADEEHRIERMAQTSKIFSLPFCEFHGAIVKIAPAAAPWFPLPPGLKPIGMGLIKPTQARAIQQWIGTVRSSQPGPFCQASPPRARSSELYLLASGFRMV